MTTGEVVQMRYLREVQLYEVRVGTPTGHLAKGRFHRVTWDADQTLRFTDHAAAVAYFRLLTSLRKPPKHHALYPRRDEQRPAVVEILTTIDAGRAEG